MSQLEDDGRVNRMLVTYSTLVVGKSETGRSGYTMGICMGQDLYEEICMGEGKKWARAQYCDFD